MTAAAGLEGSAPRGTSLRTAVEEAGRSVAGFSTAGLRRKAALTLVPNRLAAPSRAPFAIVVVAVLALGLLGLLALNTVLAQDAFGLHQLKGDASALEDREQALRREVEALRSPQTLAEKAAALGMVQAGPPAFLRLPDGAVLGSPTAAEAPVVEGVEGVAGAEGAEPAEPAEPVESNTSTGTDSSETTDGTDG